MSKILYSEHLNSSSGFTLMCGRDTDRQTNKKNTVLASESTI